MSVPLAVNHTTTANMGDGFGSSAVWTAEDATSGEVTQGVIGFDRDGADTQSKFHLKVNNAATTSLTIGTAGAVDWAQGGPHDFHGAYLDLTERAKPSNPAANEGRIYVKDDAATTKLFFLDSAGTETDLLAGGGGGDTVVGTQIMEIDASGLYPGGAVPAAGLVTKQFGANNQPIRAIQLSDGSNQEVYAQFKLNNWGTDKTIQVKAYWFVENDLATPESKTFELDISGNSLGNFNAIGAVAYGTPQTITDTTDSSAAEDKLNVSSPTSAITIAGAPVEANWVSIKMVRDAATDTAGTVYLAGISIEYSIASGTATI